MKATSGSSIASEPRRPLTSNDSQFPFFMTVCLKPTSPGARSLKP